MHDEKKDMACVNCGLIFDPIESDVDLDDVHCPECDSSNVTAASEV